ncbi:Superfamily I DNA and/or RNA helicase [Cyclonatronum proteinivorum]|uniref:Superfamily I DNA and/or RNA helicase n=1 Tax=Cyclonatronum proteinivorum TaxID=1457365 RepID=A0A345UIY9_9BACT|nr:AAA domain-containing protein [Cyclonatronum proteinivorum]AXJ00441.1 Superfamily I DNA and/or RNA helicase [Cyclonatronum proteinivorum]
MSESKKVRKLLKEAIAAVQDEIHAVQQHPRRDVLTAPEFLEDEEDFTYRFESSNPSFEHVDELALISADPPISGEVVRIDEKHIVIKFEKRPDEPFIQGEVEWVNDFVLQRTLEQLEFLSESGDTAQIERLTEIFGSSALSGEAESAEILHDGYRNEAQQQAIRKAMDNRVTYVWGPPGTGKTATLGFIVANYMKAGKKVLFASNTNRAVDVGLLSVMQALQQLQFRVEPERITRFGEAALENELLAQLSFDEQLDARRRQIIGQTLDSAQQLRLKMLEEMRSKLEKSGRKMPAKLQNEYDMLALQLEDKPGESAAEAVASELEQLRYRELVRKKLIATTLARVCTSDILPTLNFDAVVIDEASMASIPYILVLASRSKAHIVFAGDPMQLPPIATTANRKHRDFLEKDVYTMASEADSMEQLFVWKDQNPGITCFFDTQYRLEDDLAEVISEVFYDGRLKSGKANAIIHAPSQQLTLRDAQQKDKSDVSVHLVNTTRYGPWIDTPKSEYGFRPVNQVHRDLVMELVKRLVQKEQLHPSQIGIIVPFRSVVWDYRRELYSSNFSGVEVGTIHTFQGREKEAILFDLVMSGAGETQPRRHFTVRPFDETKNGLSVPRLLNVAFSRAKKHMVVLADMDHVRRVYHGKFLGNLLHKLRVNKITGKKR